MVFTGKESSYPYVIDDLARMRANLVETGLVGSERTAVEPATRTRQDTTHQQQKGDEAA